jgi:hypothetical protein
MRPGQTSRPHGRNRGNNPYVIGKRYRTEVRPSIVTVLTSKSEATLIKSLTVTSPLGGRRLQVAIASTQRTFTSTPSIIFE